MRDFEKRLAEVAVFEREDNNASKPLVLKELIFNEKPCRDCGKLIKQELHQCTVNSFPKKHCKTKCLNCNVFRHPETQKFDCSQQDITAYWRNYFTSEITKFRAAKKKRLKELAKK